MAYFKYFPEIVYDVRGKKDNLRLDFITNILVRVRKKLEITYAAIFEQYFVRDGDRADTEQSILLGQSMYHRLFVNLKN